MNSSNPISRRQILASSAAAAVTIVPRHVLGGPNFKPPSEKLNIAGVGLNGMGAGDVQNCASENIVALCDVDQRILDRVAKPYPKARLHSDFRKMLDKQKDIDAVIIATPDHNHAVVTMAALKMGKHVHCQKPLTHSVYEARMVAKAAREAKVATQMGNQGQASKEARLVCELIWSGAIGTVREVHGRSNRTPMISPRGIARPKQTAPVPPELDWDLWLGPSPARPFLDVYRAGPRFHPGSDEQAFRADAVPVARGRGGDGYDLDAGRGHLRNGGYDCHEGRTARSCSGGHPNPD